MDDELQLQIYQALDAFLMHTASNLCSDRGDQCSKGHIPSDENCSHHAAPSTPAVASPCISFRT